MVNKEVGYSIDKNQYFIKVSDFKSERNIRDVIILSITSILYIAVMIARKYKPQEIDALSIALLSIYIILIILFFPKLKNEKIIRLKFKILYALIMSITLFLFAKIAIMINIGVNILNLIFVYIFLLPIFIILYMALSSLEYKISILEYKLKNKLNEKTKLLISDCMPFIILVFGTIILEGNTVKQKEIRFAYLILAYSVFELFMAARLIYIYKHI